MDTLVSAPSAVGKEKVLYIRAASQASVSRKPVSDLKGLLLHHPAQGSSSPSDITSHPGMAERIFNNPSQLSLPGCLELGLKLIPHA